MANMTPQTQYTKHKIAGDDDDDEGGGGVR